MRTAAGPSGLGGPGTTLRPVHGPGWKGNSSQGQWPPALEPQGRFCWWKFNSGGEKFGSKKPAPRGDLQTPVPGSGVERGKSQSGLLASGFPRVLLGNFLRTPCCAPQNPFHKHLWKHSTPGTKLSGIKPLAELIPTTAQTLERGVWAEAWHSTLGTNRAEGSPRALGWETGTMACGGWRGHFAEAALEN